MHNLGPSESAAIWRRIARSDLRARRGAQVAVLTREGVGEARAPELAARQAERAKRVCPWARRTEEDDEAASERGRARRERL